MRCGRFRLGDKRVIGQIEYHGIGEGPASVHSQSVSPFHVPASLGIAVSDQFVVQFGTDTLLRVFAPLDAEINIIEGDETAFVA